MISQYAASVSRVASILVIAVLTGCSGQPVAPSATAGSSTAALSTGERAVEVALAQLGTPYRYGGATPSGFDCSGLVHYSYLKAGKSVPRTTGQLWDESTTVEARNIRKGDILFFRIDGKMSHVGLYVGNSRFVHAPSTGRTVSVESLESDFYRHALIRAGRLR